jgi:hypothetical protein
VDALKIPRVEDITVATWIFGMIQIVAKNCVQPAHLPAMRTVSPFLNEKNSDNGTVVLNEFIIQKEG